MEQVDVELPLPLLEQLPHDGGLCRRLGELLALGLDRGLPAEPTGPASHPDSAQRKRIAADGLTHYLGRAWYLTLAVARLRRQQADMESKLDEIEGRGG